MQHFKPYLFIFIGVIAINSCGQPKGSKNNDVKEVIPPKIGLRDFFKNPEKTSFQISPDGSHFSFMSPYENRMNVFVQRVGEDSALRVTDVTDRDISGYGWANNQRIYYLKDK
ncbi:MAG: hypothetical protein ABII90_06265 [Bacteroidota bacterium]